MVESDPDANELAAQKSETITPPEGEIRAVRYHEFGGADVLEVEDVAPPRPAPDEVLLEVRAASVNRVDVLFRSGAYGDVEPPAVPGGDGAGVVAAVGDEVDRFAVGERVFASGMDRADGGTFAEYAAIPASKLAHLPEGVSFEAGAAVANVGATAWTAIEEVAGVRAGDRVLVHGGAGGVGHAAVQIASASGADVIATAGTEQARERVRSLGASTVLDYDSDSLVEDVLAATDGEGVETVLDHRLEEYLETDLQVVADGGTVVAIMGHVPSTSGVPLYDKQVTVRALKMDAHPERTATLERLARLLERGDLDPVVAETYDLASADRAQERILQGGYVGKLVVTP